MKRYKKYMDGVRASDTLRQRLLELEAPEKRPIPWIKYGTVAAALVLALGLGGWRLSKLSGGSIGQLLANFQSMAETAPDIALVEPGGEAELGEKTLGGYEVVSGSGENAIATYYVLPYIEYGDAGRVNMMAGWDTPDGVSRRDLTQEEIIALMGGEDAVNTHLGWGDYQLTGWGAWYEDGSFWGAYIDGLLMYYGEAGNLFQFVVTAGQLPPTCFAYPNSVTQEIRGLTVTADRADWEEHNFDWPTYVHMRRVSFMKGDYGYYFEMLCGGSGEAAEELASRLVCRVADKGLALSTVDRFETADPSRHASSPPTLRVLASEGHVEGGSGGYEWEQDLGNGETACTIACGVHPLDFRDAPSLTTTDGTVTLNFLDLPDRVQVVCWPDSEWGNTGAARQAAGVTKGGETYSLTLKEGGWIYEISAEWDGHGTASYVFYLIKN